MSLENTVTIDRITKIDLAKPLSLPNQLKIQTSVKHNWTSITQTYPKPRLFQNLGCKLFCNSSLYIYLSYLFRNNHFINTRTKNLDVIRVIISLRDNLRHVRAPGDILIIAEDVYSVLT